MYIPDFYVKNNDLTKTSYNPKDNDYLKGKAKNYENFIDPFLKCVKEIYENNKNITNDERNIAFENIEKIRKEIKKE